MDEHEITRQACIDLGSRDAATREKGRRTLYSMQNLPVDVIMERITVADYKEKRLLLSNFPALATASGLNSPESIPFFFQNFLKEKDDLLRRHFMGSIAALLKICSVESFEDAILPYILDEHSEVRRIVCQHVDACRNPKAVPYLALLLDDGDERLCFDAKKALQSIGTPAALYALEEWQKRNKS